MDPALADDLERFVQAQAPHLAAVRSELAAGRKRSHWMWFVFPQLRGLGRSEMARHYGLRSRMDAAAYLAHPTLGPRLRAWTALVLDAAPGRSAHEIFGSPDDLKLHSCLTLFAAVDDAAAAPGLFARALARFYESRPDSETLRLLDEPPAS